MSTLPPQISVATITGVLTSAVVDTTGTGLVPAGQPLSGTVTFTPDKVNGQLLVPTATPKLHVSVMPEPFQLAADGSLLAKLVVIPAATYTVSFNCPGVTIFPFSIGPLVAGQSYDLADLAPVMGMDGTTYIKGDPGRDGVDGSNVLPTDTAISAAITTPASATRTSLNAAFAGHGRGASRTILSGKLRGANIACKPGGPQWGGLFAEWDWGNWIKPQVDRAAALGLNAIRLIGGANSVLMSNGAASPQITQASYIARWCQLADYCQIKGLYLYPVLVTGGDATGPGIGYQDAGLTALVAASATALAAYSNVIAFDIFQEAALPTAATDVLAMMTSVRAAAPGVPLTCSHAGSIDWHDLTSDVATQVVQAVGGSDFMDIHVYEDGIIPSTPDFLLAIVKKPFLVGEFGASQSMTTAQQTARYTDMAAIHNRPGMMGTFLWALADQDTVSTNQWGLWDNTGFGPAYPAASTAPLSVTAGKRAAMTDTLASFLPDTLVALPYVAPNMVTRLSWADSGNENFSNGSKGLSVAAIIAGNTIASTPKFPVVVGTPYRIHATALAAVTARTVKMQVVWFTAASAWNGTTSSATGIDSAEVPASLDLVVTPPANTATGMIQLETDACAAGEMHYFNEVTMRPWAQT